MYEKLYTYVNGQKIYPINHSYLNHPLIKEKLNKIRSYDSDFKIGNNDKKYFKEKPGITYASGVSIKLYSEKSFEDLNFLINS